MCAKLHSFEDLLNPTALATQVTSICYLKMPSFVDNFINQHSCLEMVISFNQLTNTYSVYI